MTSRSPTPTRHTTVLACALALLLTLAGCGTAPLSPRAPAPAGGYETPSRLSLAQANDVTLHAISLVGTPYRYGGNTPTTGFDCSGLIGYVYKARAAIASPRTVAALNGWGKPVAGGDVRTGDLVVFTQGSTSTHAGIYVGEGRFVHAPSTGGVVRLDRLNASYWASQQVTFRRP